MNDKERTNKRKVHCDGGENGHPLIYLEVSGEETCPYCGKIFIYDDSNEST